MKRNPDLIRDILEYIEENHNGINYIQSNHIKLDGVNLAEISYHLGLLSDSNMIIAKERRDSGAPPFWIVYRLTNDGHEFLEAARNETNWNKTKENMTKAGGFVVEIAKEILIDLMKKQLQNI